MRKATNHVLPTARARHSLWMRPVALLILASACSDRTATGPLTAPGASRYIALDTEMDRTDSYSAADVTVETSTTLTYDQPVPHPDTGAPVTTITTATPAEQIAVETGYDAYGRTRTALYFRPDPDPAADASEQTATVRTINDDQYTWDLNGRMVAMDADDPRITDDTGTLVDAPVTEGLVTGDPRSVDAVAFYSITPGAPGARIAAPAAGARPRVEQLAPNRVRVSVEGVRVTIPAAEGRGQGRGSIARTYRKEKDDWLLEEIRVEGEETPSSGARAKHAQTLRFSNVRWHRNPSRDEARRRRRAERARAGNLAPAPTAPSAMIAECSGSLDTYESECGGNTPGDDPGPTEDSGSTGSSDAVGSAAMEWRLPYAGASTGTRLLVQHGFMDNGSSYRKGRVGEALRANFYYDQLLFPSTGWAQTYEDQARELISIVDANRGGAGDYVFIGYSNGGIISRQVGQWRPDLVRGVVAVSSPHHGVPVMRVGRTVLNRLLQVSAVGLIASCNLRSFHGCDAPQAYAQLSGRYGMDEMWPVSYEMVPNSAYLQSLNSRAEGWRKVSIEQHTRQRWAFWRVYKDLGCAGPELPCGGREAVRKLDKSYKNLLAKTVVTGILGFVVPGLHASTVMYAMAVAGLNAMDWLYDRVTSPGDGSDGVVPNQSQVYPNADRRAIIENADSHDAAKKSQDKAIRRLNQVLFDERWAPTTDGARP